MSSAARCLAGIVLIALAGAAFKCGWAPFGFLFGVAAVIVMGTAKKDPVDSFFSGLSFLIVAGVLARVIQEVSYYL